MSFNNFQKQPQQPFYQNQNVAPRQQNQFQQQNVQPLFPQPQGNVYNINSTLEVANVPVGAGISVAGSDSIVAGVACVSEVFSFRIS